MKRTYAVLGKAALAVSLGMAAASAHAVPIVFDFAGTVTYTTHYENGQYTEDLSRAGQAVVGRITVETDGLTPRSSTTSLGTFSSYNDFAGNLTSSDASIGGVAYDMAIYPRTFGSVTGFDTSVPPCDPGPACGAYPDFIYIMQGSRQDYWSQAQTGEFYERMLSLTWSDPSNLYGLVDLSLGFDPTDLISSLAGLLPEYGYYDESTWTCVEGECDNTAFSSTMFAVDRISVSTPSVPEPGTLALFAIGLLGSGVARRSVLNRR